MKNEVSTPQVDVTTNAVLDLKVTKEDVLSVLIQEEEDRLTSLTEGLQSQIEDISKKRRAILDKIEDKIAEPYVKQVPEECFAKFKSRFSRDAIGHMQDVVIKIYNVEHLSSLVNPSRGKAHKINEYVQQLELRDRTKTVSVDKYITDQDGFKGTVTKFIDVKLSKSTITFANTKLKTVNQLNIEKYDLVKERNELEYRILTLDSNRAFKNKLTKTILKSADLNQLLLK